MKHLKYLTFLIPEKPQYSVKRVAIKTGIMICMGHLIFDNAGFNFNQSNPQLVYFSMIRSKDIQCSIR